MNIKTKFDVGDEVFFFKDYDKAKPRVTKDIVDGIVIAINLYITTSGSERMYYYVAINNGEVKISESQLYGSYEEIESKAVDKLEKKVDDSVKAAYEELGRKLGLI